MLVQPTLQMLLFIQHVVLLVEAQQAHLVQVLIHSLTMHLDVVIILQKEVIMFKKLDLQI